uniref:Uncharacterized protein n=1 Tax=Anguilla anguilla TaxID=7936 RepID=A0A0E9RZ83_ANGAN
MSITVWVNNKHCVALCHFKFSIIFYCNYLPHVSSSDKLMVQTGAKQSLDLTTYYGSNHSLVMSSACTLCKSSRSIKVKSTL